MAAQSNLNYPVQHDHTLPKNLSDIILSRREECVAKSLFPKEMANAASHVLRKGAHRRCYLGWRAKSGNFDRKSLMYVVCKERIRQKVCPVYANEFVATRVRSLEARREPVIKSWLE